LSGPDSLVTLALASAAAPLSIRSVNMPAQARSLACALRRFRA
jgi:hypothetical protein